MSTARTTRARDDRTSGFDFRVLLKGLPKGTHGEVWYELAHSRHHCVIKQPHGDGAFVVFRLEVTDEEHDRLSHLNVKLHHIFAAKLRRADATLEYDKPVAEIEQSAGRLDPGA